VPVIEPGSWLHAETRPDWSGIGSIGRFAVPTEGGRFERHRHRVEEVWMVWEGKGKIVVDGGERYVQAGDIVLTRAGDVHDIVEVYETLRGFFIETGLEAGHVDGEAHDVPALPLPADFPLR
jgi:mannose-6-phosphate isomerase-like protein (cupin superfamily)